MERVRDTRPKGVNMLRTANYINALLTSHEYIRVLKPNVIDKGRKSFFLHV